MATFKVTTVYSKPSDDIEWHKPIALSPELFEKYEGNRMVLKTEDVDNVMSIEVIWVSKEALDAFMEEPEVVAQYEAIDAYHREVNITKVGREVLEYDKTFQQLILGE